VAYKQEELEAMERDTDLILASYATLTPEALEALSPEERRKVNVMLDPTVEALADGTLKMSGAFGEETPAWEIEGTSRRFSPRADLPSSKTFGFDLVLREGAPLETSFRKLGGT
jgi:hypothetical protein